MGLDSSALRSELSFGHFGTGGGLAKICRDAGTADAWTPVTDAPVIDAGTAVQRVRHAPWPADHLTLIKRPLK